jgi:hypothetical protein
MFPKLKLIHRYNRAEKAWDINFMRQVKPNRTLTFDLPKKIGVKIGKRGKINLSLVSGHFFNAALDKFSDFLFTEFTFVFLLFKLFFD